MSLLIAIHWRSMPTRSGSLCQSPEFSCLNGGSCHEHPTGNGTSCICPSNFSGSLCENAVDSMARCVDPSPCLNGGTCHQSNGALSSSVRQDLAVPGGQTMSTIVLIHPFVSTGAFASTESTISPAPATGNLFSLFSLAIVDCCCCYTVTKEKGVKQRSIIVYRIPAKMAGLVSIVTADLFGSVFADLAATNPI